MPITIQGRDEAHRAVIHLTSLISGQTIYIERVLSSLIMKPCRSNFQQESSGPRSETKKRRSFQGLQTSSPQISPVLLQFPLLKPVHENMSESRRRSTEYSQAALARLNAAIAVHTPPEKGMSQIEWSDSAQNASFKEKLGAVADTVHKINQQCLAAIQDLAGKRTEMTSSSPYVARGLASEMRNGGTNGVVGCGTLVCKRTTKMSNGGLQT